MVLEDSPCELGCQAGDRVVRLGESARDGAMCGDRYFTTAIHYRKFVGRIRWKIRGKHTFEFIFLEVT